MSEDNKPQNGKFYWVRIANDPDTDDAWVNEAQPALYFNDKWILLGVDSDESDWPVIWVGSEIVQ